MGKNLASFSVLIRFIDELVVSNFSDHPVDGGGGVISGVGIVPRCDVVVSSPVRRRSPSVTDSSGADAQTGRQTDRHRRAD